MTMPVRSATVAPLHPALDSALAELLAGTRAQSVRLVDLASGRALAGRTAQPVAPDPGADLALARLAEAAFAAAAFDGGFGDLVLAGPLATHVLAPGPYGSVLVVRLGPGTNVGIARRAVRAPRLAAALQAGHPAAHDIGNAIRLPRQRGGPSAVTDTGPMQPLRAVPAPSGSTEPALAELAVVPFAGRTGELAARALGDLGAPAPVGASPEASIPLPRRGSGEPVADGVANTRWSHDISTMRRLLDGLRRLS